MDGSAILEKLGGEEGCRKLSATFYALVAKDPILRPLFPGKTLRCAIHEFAAFLIQFLGGDENQTQDRWWLSLRESHARFEISAIQRSAWLKNMSAALEAAPLDPETRQALQAFFRHTSSYTIGNPDSPETHPELGPRWAAQRTLDDIVAAITAEQEQQVRALLPLFTHRPSVFTGILARMVKSAPLIPIVIEALEANPALITQRFAGRNLLHFAAGAGCLPVVLTLLRLGANANVLDRGNHTPLYSVANECASESGPGVVRALIQAGAHVNAADGVTRATPLHMAARRGHLEIARTLLDSGAAINARDSKGDTPRQRALNCRRPQLAQMLAARGGI
jgi:hemoglobin